MGRARRRIATLVLLATYVAAILLVPALHHAEDPGDACADCAPDHATLLANCSGPCNDSDHHHHHRHPDHQTCSICKLLGPQISTQIAAYLTPPTPCALRSRPSDSTIAFAFARALRARAPPGAPSIQL